MMSFFSAWKLTNVLVEYFPSTKVAAIIAFLFFPSVVFWSSESSRKALQWRRCFFECGCDRDLARKKIAMVGMDSGPFFSMAALEIKVLLPGGFSACFSSGNHHTSLIPNVAGEKCAIKMTIWTVMFIGRLLSSARCDRIFIPVEYWT
jgi:hypothetical protein